MGTVSQRFIFFIDNFFSAADRKDLHSVVDEVLSKTESPTIVMLNNFIGGFDRLDTLAFRYRDLI